MILGIGSDLVEIARIARLLECFPERFPERLCVASENAAASLLGTPHQKAAFYAKRFAAKEACLKALGTGLAEGVSWHEIRIQRGPKGQPLLELSGVALQRAWELIPSGLQGTVQIHLSLSDERSLAQAFVVLSVLR